MEAPRTPSPRAPALTPPSTDKKECDQAKRSQGGIRLRAATSDLSTPPDSPATPHNRLPHRPRVDSGVSGVTRGIATPPETPDASPKTTSNRRQRVLQHLSQDVVENAAREHGAQEPITFMPSSNDRLVMGARIGEGQWSSVHRALLEQAPSATLSNQSPTSSILLAVKQPAGRRAQAVLQHEANILTRLMQRSNSHDFVVAFYGVDKVSNGLVLEYVDVILEKYISNTSLLAMQDPPHDYLNTDSHNHFTLADSLLRLTRDLIHGLVFIHSCDVIHGDIKPANILLRRDPHDQRLYTPLYADFSSARLNFPDHSPPCDSAQTYDYMAPELFATREPANWPTPASDVYALGVTLLHAVLGHSPYDDPTSGTSADWSFGGRARRRIAAAQGAPYYFARQTVLASKRLQASGLEQLLQPAVMKAADERCTAFQWSRCFADEVW